MGNTSSGMQRAHEESDKRREPREEARKQRLAEQNVTGASPPDVDEDEVDTAGFAGHTIPQSPGNIASRR